MSVSTVKDTPKNLRRFVRRNLANGIDHMVVFLDVSDVECERVLTAHPHVTCVVTDEEYWRGNRPAGLNRRQNTNANLVNAVLTRFEWAGWLFHIDADEVVHLDRDRLEQLDSTVRMVHLRPLESVSRKRLLAREAHLFKRLLSADELALLRLLGVLESPSNKLYFHGHVAGKSGVRPSLDLRVGIHRSKGVPGVEAAGFSADWLEVLHLESPSEKEFVRKWSNLITSGTRPRTRSARANLMCAIDTLYALHLRPSARRRYLRRLYRTAVVDDVAELKRLNLLEQVDPDQRRYEPRAISAADRELLGSFLRRAGHEDRQVFRTGAPDRVEEVLSRVR